MYVLCLSLYSDRDFHILILQDEGELKPSKACLSSVPIVLEILSSVTLMSVKEARSTFFSTHTSIALLYPSDKAKPLTSDVSLQTLTVLDGSWRSVQVKHFPLSFTSPLLRHFIIRTHWPQDLIFKNSLITT